jgi:hypothetical protein
LLSAGAAQVASAWPLETAAWQARFLSFAGSGAAFQARPHLLWAARRAPCRPATGCAPECRPCPPLFQRLVVVGSNSLMINPLLRRRSITIPSRASRRSAIWSPRRCSIQDDRRPHRGCACEARHDHAWLGPATTQHIAAENFNYVTKSEIIVVPFPGANMSMQSGYPNYASGVCLGILGPAGTRAERVEQPSKWLSAVMSASGVVSRLESVGLYPTLTCSEEFVRFIVGKKAKYGRTIHEAKIALDKYVQTPAFFCSCRRKISKTSDAAPKIYRQTFARSPPFAPSGCPSH